MASQADTRLGRRKGDAQPFSPILPAGTLVGDYLLSEVLASGGCGTVYRAQHRVLGRPAALKVLHSDLASSVDAVMRFEQEARAVNLIRQRNVVDVYDIGRLPDGRPFLVMELLVGMALDAHLEKLGRIELADAVGIVREVAGALSAAHEVGIVHRDVKASNVFVAGDREGRRIVLLDFGIAKLITPDGLNLTTSHHVLGTPAFMAPEQILGGTIDHRTDIYALGALLFHVLTGRLPFDGDSISFIQHQHLHSERPHASMFGRVPLAVDEVIVKAMAREPRDRYEDIVAFVADLDRAVRQVPAVELLERATTQEVLAVYVEIQAEAAAIVEHDDDAIMADAEAVLETAVAELDPLGFRPVFEGGSSTLLFRPLTGADQDALAAVARLQRALVARPARDARLAVGVCLHVGEVVVVDGAVEGGPTTQVSGWAPRQVLPGLVATATAAARLGLACEPVEGGFVRLV